MSIETAPSAEKESQYWDKFDLDQIFELNNINFDDFAKTELLDTEDMEAILLRRFEQKNFSAQEFSKEKLSENPSPVFSLLSILTANLADHYSKKGNLNGIRTPDDIFLNNDHHIMGKGLAIINNIYDNSAGKSSDTIGAFFGNFSKLVKAYQEEFDQASASNITANTNSTNQNILSHSTAANFSILAGMTLGGVKMGIPGIIAGALGGAFTNSTVHNAMNGTANGINGKSAKNISMGTVENIKGFGSSFLSSIGAAKDFIFQKGNEAKNPIWNAGKNTGAWLSKFYNESGDTTRSKVFTSALWGSVALATAWWGGKKIIKGTKWGAKKTKEKIKPYKNILKWGGLATIVGGSMLASGTLSAAGESISPEAKQKNYSDTTKQIKDLFSKKPSLPKNLMDAYIQNNLKFFNKEKKWNDYSSLSNEIKYLLIQYKYLSENDFKNDTHNLLTVKNYISKQLPTKYTKNNNDLGNKLFKEILK